MIKVRKTVYLLSFSTRYELIANHSLNKREYFLKNIELIQIENNNFMSDLMNDWYIFFDAKYLGMLKNEWMNENH